MDSRHPRSDLVGGTDDPLPWIRPVNRLTALRAFVAVVEEGSFAAAARTLHLSGAGVSKNIRTLEADLDVRLFHRTTRAMSLTDAGAVYYERMRTLLADMAAADEAVAGLASAPRGTLRVTAPMSVGLLRLSPLVPRFLAAHPGISLDLHLADEKDDLVHGGFDLAIRGTGSLPDSTLKARRLAALRHVVVAGAGYVERANALESPDDLGDRPCLLYANAPRPDRWTLRQGDAERTVRVTGPFTANSSLALRDAVLADVGIALMPRLYVEEDLAAGRVVTLLDGWSPPDLSLFAIYPPGPATLARVRLFIDFLAEHLRGFEAMTPTDMAPDGPAPRD